MNEAEKLMKGYVNKDDLFIIHDALVLMTAKETIKWMRHIGYLHGRLLPLNGIQYGTPNFSSLIGNIPEFIPLYDSLKRNISHSLRMHSVLSRYILDGEKTKGEESNMCFSYSKSR